MPMQETYSPPAEEHEDASQVFGPACATSPDGAFGGGFTASPAEGSAAEGAIEELPRSLAALILRVEPPDVRDFVRGLFANVLRLLGHVESVRAVVENGGSLDWITRVLGALNKSSSYLLTSIETAELRVENLSNGLAESLDAAGFALRHELRRVFEQELGPAGGGDEPGRRLCVLRACALLENCLQQLTVGLARTFDAGLSGAELFENYRKRREESLALREELRALLDKLRAVEKEYGVLAGMSLLNQLRRFRYERLHHLMYRDWEDFERFADAAELSYESEEEMAGLLNRLSCYLEALLSQVEMRAALADG